ncbi:MAG: S8 family peptidase [Flavobacteriales bacterium]|nr:S8 family peptidase [Flavobacteriales bacterium]
MIKKLLFLILLFAAVIGHGQQGARFEAGQLIVQIDPKVDATSLLRRLESQHGMPLHEVKLLSEIVSVYLIEFEDHATNLDEAIQILYSYSPVLAVQKNHLVTQRETIPTDTLFNNQWHLRNEGDDGGTIDADIDADEAWDITTGGLTTHEDTIVVAIIEGSGVDISHVDLAENIWHNYGEIPDDGIDNDGNGYIDDFDGWNIIDDDDAVGSGSHGTRVSGMIGARGNNITGVSGVNWNVKMMIIKGQSASNEASVIEAYTYPLTMRKLYNESYGEKGAFVVVTNASWGVDGGDPDNAPIWCAMYDTLGSYGVLNIGATTNDDENVDVIGDLPTTCESDYLIAVTMSNKNDIREGSGYGVENVDLAAPGASVYLTFPSGNYATTSGTSFATPCVAGAVALAYSAPCASFIGLAKYDPAAAALQMREYILENVDLKPALASEVATGGRLNVNSTILAMLDECDPNPCIAPYNLHHTELTDELVTIEWDGFTDDYIVYITFGSGPLIPVPITGNSITIDTLKPCTNYSIMVKSDCGDGELSEFSYSYSFTSDGCCNNPPLSAFDIYDNGMSISWPPVLYATQYDFRYREFGTEDWTTLTDVSSPVNLDEMNFCTKYEFQIYTLCADSTHGFSESSFFRTKGCGACTEADYCPISGASFNLEWINAIALNGYTNFTGVDGGWLVSNEIITALTPGESYIFTITPGYAGFNFTERFSSWIDFNHNGIFDPEEKIIDDMSSNEPLNANIFIPATATIGVTKLRIGMSALSSPEACQSENFFGEYEDYCVYLGPQVGLEEIGQEDWSVYPNPAENTLYVQSNDPILSAAIISPEGKIIQQHNGNIKTFDLSEMATGIYLIQIQTENGISTQKFIKQ